MPLDIRVMKIVNFEQFCKYPPGTIYSYFEPDVFLGLNVKEDSIYDETTGPRMAVDFFYRNLLPEFFNMAAGEDDEMHIGMKTRWGEYHFDQQFAIYETEDLATLKGFIDNAKSLHK